MDYTKMLCGSCQLGFSRREWKDARPVKSKELWPIYEIYCKRNSRIPGKDDWLHSRCRDWIRKYKRKNPKYQKKMDQRISKLHGERPRAEDNQEQAERRENMDYEVSDDLDEEPLEHVPPSEEYPSPELIDFDDMEVSDENSFEQNTDTRTPDVLTDKLVAVATLLKGIEQTLELALQSNIYSCDNIDFLHTATRDIKLKADRIHEIVQSSVLQTSEITEESGPVAAEAVYSEPVSLVQDTEVQSFAVSKSPTLTLPVTTAMYTEKKCCVCGEQYERLSRCVVPQAAIDDLWITERILMRKGTRACKAHMGNDAFLEPAKIKLRLQIQDHNKERASKGLKEFQLTITALEIVSLLNRISDIALLHEKILVFDADTPDEDYKLFLGVTKPIFEQLHSSIQKEMRNSSKRSTRQAVAICLTKLRLGCSQKVIGHLYGIQSQSTISSIFAKVTKLLHHNFVPLHLGFGRKHMDRKKALEQHNKGIASKLYNVPPQNLNFIADATYLYVHKPRNHAEQTKTFSAQKKRNLVKIMKFVYTDGYIADVQGVFYTNRYNNDASILNKIIDEDVGGFLTFTEPGDNFILDRGFHDSENKLIDLGFTVQIPFFLNKANQFSSYQANKIRTITLERWKIEAANGRIKNIFNFFANEIEIQYIKKLPFLYRIAAAITNAMCKPFLIDPAREEEIIKTCQQRLEMANLLQSRIQRLGLERKSSAWRPVTEIQLEHFPVLSMQDLVDLSLGYYQLANAEEYHRRLQGFFLYKDDRCMLRANYLSRYHSGVYRSAFIEFNNTRSGISQILAYYCKCPIGARNVGICGHAMAALWYLAYRRHQSKPLRTSTLASHILDAACRLHNNNQIQENDVPNSEAQTEDTLELNTQELSVAMNANSHIEFELGTEPTITDHNELFPPGDRFGITNIGNSCYINSVIQLLGCVNELQDPEFLSSLPDVFSCYIRHILQKTMDYCTAEAAKKNLTDILTMYKENVQEDASEFLMFLLGMNGMEAARRLFEFKVCTVTSCVCSRNIPNSVSKFEIMALVSPKKSLVDELSSSFEPKPTNCEPCFCGNQFSRKCSIITLPMYYIVVYKIYDKKMRKRKGVKSLVKEFVYESCGERYKFKLASCIEHCDSKFINEGHYKCFIVQQDSFKCCDDHLVIDNIRPNSHDVYVCLYKRCAKP